jgi:hypothetical protein
MKRAILLLFFIAAAAHAQIGWNLEQCRKHFGAEFTPTDTDSYRFSDNMSYTHVDWSKFNEWRKIHTFDKFWFLSVPTALINRVTHNSDNARDNEMSRLLG